MQRARGHLIPGFLAGGLEYSVVAQGQVDGASFPIATPAFDPTTHLCWMPPTRGYGGTTGPGGYYTWDGGSIAVAAWPGAAHHWPSAAWEIWRIKNLSAPIQAIAGNVNLGGVSGWGNFDASIAPVPDYSKAVVIPCSWGFAQTGTSVQGYTTAMYEFLPNNDTLRRRVAGLNQNGAGVGTIYFSTLIVPTR